MTRAVAMLVAAWVCVVGQSGVCAQEFRPGKGRAVETLNEAGAKAVRARLICETTALVPGQAGWLAIALDIAPGWHVYWKNSGDTGQPVSWEIDAPATLMIGEALWPAPKRYLSAGEILDYTYEERVTILLPVTLSSAHPVGEAIRVRARVAWLVCREGCVPGEVDIDQEFQVAASSAVHAADALRFAETRDLLPRPAVEMLQAGASARWEGSRLVLSAQGADSLEFYPHASEIRLPQNLLQTGAATGSTLVVDYRIKDGGQVGSRESLGVLMVNRDGRRRYYEVDVPPLPR